MKNIVISKGFLVNLLEITRSRMTNPILHLGTIQVGNRPMIQNKIVKEAIAILLVLEGRISYDVALWWLFLPCKSVQEIFSFIPKHSPTEETYQVHLVLKRKFGNHGVLNPNTIF